MFQRNNQLPIRDTVLLSGWLFADLMLALFVIFLAANTFVVRPKPPTLLVSPTSLNPTNLHCPGGIGNLQCGVKVTVGETSSSQGNVDWTASSDINNAVIFSPAKGTLSPGKSVTVAISSFPCQNGSFTFSGSRGASPVSVLWHCTPSSRILEHNYCRIKLNMGDPTSFINDDVASARKVLEPQLNQESFLKGRQVGIAIAYGGARDGNLNRGSQAANQIYNVLKAIAKDQRAQMYGVFNPASLYEPLFTELEDPNTAIINVYLIQRSDHPGETCDSNNHNVIG